MHYTTTAALIAIYCQDDKLEVRVSIMWFYLQIC